MEYLPIKAEQIREYASYDKKSKTYDWVRLGYYNYTLSFFGTSVPEVIKTKKNKDGTYTLTVAAVCEMVLNDDVLITHKLKIKLGEDGSFKYLGNRIQEEVLRDLPAYQYRVGRTKRVARKRVAGKKVVGKWVAEKRVTGKDDPRCPDRTGLTS